MKKIDLSKEEKILIILRDTTWFFLLYILIRSVISTFFDIDINLNISLTIFEKIIGIIVWCGLIFLTYFTKRVHEEIKKRYGGLLLFHFARESSILVIIIIILIELLLIFR